MKELLTPKQVASALGLSEASLKRWCDKGLLPAIRTAGGHRRVPLNAVLNFVRDRGYELVRPEILGLPPATGRGEHAQKRTLDLLLAALENGDEDQCRQIVYNRYLGGQRLFEICDQLLGPAFLAIGQRWQHGEMEVYQERRAVEICTRLLHECRSMLPTPPPDAPIAIGATLEDDPYTLPTTMVEIALREAGWAAHSYGAGHPAETLVAALHDVRPSLFWLSVSAASDQAVLVENCRALYAAALSCGAAFVVGGRALTQEVRKQIQYSAFCDQLSHLVAFAQTLHAPV